MPDPVAISIDNQGRAFVTQTKRRKSQDLDIRKNRDWVPADVGMQSVQEKIDFYHQQMPLGGNSKQRVEDLNQDGYHDYKDLRFLSEEIHLLQDTNGDGKADKTQLFAAGFQTEVTGIAAGVFAHQGDIYATIAPDVWRLRDTNADGTADERTIMATGFGLHIAYAGHDMHGLTVGPDGKIYWSIGDKGISVTSQEGEKFHYPNQGGVMRCNPDGSDFEVFAHGLRNVQEIAFDQYGNLFGVDNDSDQPTEKERFVYIVKGMEAGWRNNYQYRGKSYNPWTREKLWQPKTDEHSIYFTPPIQNYIDGPAGFAFNPGTALSPEYHDYFFLTGAPAGIQHAFQIEEDGASFKMINEHQIGKGVPLVGINFGPDGALYGVDWGGGYPLNQTGAVWSIDVPDQQNSDARQEVKRLLKNGFTDSSVIDLQELLAHADQRIRLAAQFELVARNAGQQLVHTSQKDYDQLARIHAIWGLGQLIRSEQLSIADSLLTQLLKDSDEEVRSQSLKIIADLPEFDSPYLLIGSLEDAAPRVQFFAATALAQHSTPKARQAIISLLEKNNGDDVYLRHAGIIALSALENLAELANHASVEVRRCTVVALRNQASVDVAKFLSDENDLVVAEAALAIHDDWSIPGAMLELAELLTTTSTQNEAILYRAINANYRLGDQASAARIVKYSQNTSVPTKLRLEALDALYNWKNREELDRVDGRNRRDILSERERSIDKKMFYSQLYQLLEDKRPEVQAATLALIRHWDVPLKPQNLLTMVRQESTADQIRIEAFSSLMESQTPELAQAIDIALSSKSTALRVHALKQLSNSAKEGHQASALKQVASLLNSSESKNLVETQAAILALGELKQPESIQLLQSLLTNTFNSKHPLESQLEVIEAATNQKKDSTEIALLLQKIEELRSQAKNPENAYRESLAGGNPALGEKIFTTNINAQCVRCHKIGKQGSEVGPALDDVATRRTPEYILRSIVSPNTDIDAKYKTRSVLLDSGKIVQGIIVSETDDLLIMKDAQGKEIKIDVDEIEDEVDQKVSIMPDVLKILTRRDIRDLVAYLRTMTKPVKK
ncbi:MAG: hypothetical protein COA78_09885 [Blastopirellula sp.]|nr:MAG: hypothetical protein COA78_09885 [Blastopirellula sp.]